MYKLYEYIFGKKYLLVKNKDDTHTAYKPTTIEGRNFIYRAACTEFNCIIVNNFDLYKYKRCNIW